MSYNRFLESYSHCDTNTSVLHLRLIISVIPSVTIRLKQLRQCSSVEDITLIELVESLSVMFSYSCVAQ